MRNIHPTQRMRVLGQVSAVAIFALIGVWRTPAFGQTLAIWGGGTGNWTKASNWSCFCVPNGNVDVNIGNYFAAGNLNGTVILNMPASVDLVALGNGAIGTLDVSGTKNTLTTSTLYAGTSAGGHGTLNITGGHVSDSNAAIGLETRATGTATVTGSGAQWNNSGYFEVGQQGVGTLSIQSGGVVTSNGASVGEFAGSSGSVTVSGGGSKWTDSGFVSIGPGGHGTLSIQNGAVVESPFGGIGGAGGTGTVTVSGAGSIWDLSNSSEFQYGLTVGNGGHGTLTIKGGGAVNSYSGNYDGGLGIGVGGGTGSVTVTGVGSELSILGSTTLTLLFVGASGQGNLTIQNGGVVNAVLLSVGEFGHGSMSLSNGGVLNTQGSGIVGWTSGSSGSVTVTGSGSMWNDSESIDIGVGGQGTLAIKDGGVVNNQAGYVSAAGSFPFTTGAGTVVVSGSGSQWNNAFFLEVGQQGPGTLTIENGGVVTDSNPYTGECSACVGVESGSTGTVTVSGAGSKWNNLNGPVVLGGLGYFSGSGGKGTVSLNAQATGTSVGLDIGATQGGTGTFTMTDPGTMWTNTGGQVIVGDAGTGTLRVQNGAVLLNSSDLVVGNKSGGNGMLTITGGGQVNNVKGMIGGASSSMGTVTVSGVGSQWNNSGSLNIGINGTGTLTVENGGLVSAGTQANPGTITIGSLGTVDAKGGTLQGNVVNDGLMDPLGTIKLVGNYTQQSGGTLLLDVAGTGTGQYGQIDITGSGTLDGTLDLDFIDHFAPTAGETFDFVNVGGSGSFSGLNVEISGLKPGFNYSGGFSNGAYDITALNNGSSVPEPSTWLLLGISLLGVGILSRRALAGC
jgi:T5SS/PEP-CTERM-associated repeat protein